MPATAATTLLAALLAIPPSGRPPIGPLERHDPKVYEVRFEIALTTDAPGAFRHPLAPSVPLVAPGAEQLPIDWNRSFELVDTPIVMPLIMQGAFSRVDRDSIAGSLWLDHVADADLAARARIEDGAAFHQSLAIMPIVRFSGKTIRWNLRWKGQSWSSRIDDAGAAAIPWPREWPEEYADALRPQLFVESDHPIFAETIARISEGNLRFVPPYLAAKDIVRHCIANVQVSGNSMFRGRFGIFHGMVINGAAATAAAGRGGPVDLVCVCVAMLRAAGIPARPVIGMTEDEEKGRNELVVWAEFHLPDAGWIPFDPIAMRGKAILHRNVREPWPEFGTMKDLNEVIPLAYTFLPPATVESPIAAAVWGWDPRPNGAPNAEQTITLTIASLGRGVDDPK